MLYGESLVYSLIPTLFSPGLIHTNVTASFGIPEEKMPEVYKKFVKKNVPMGRLGIPMEVVSLFLFRLSISSRLMSSNF